MGAKAAITVHEYLHTAFPDREPEYRDGELLERSLPDYLHGKTQAVLVAFFMALRANLPLFPCVETRMRLRPNLFLIPDVAVFYQIEPQRVPEVPPLIVIEVLSLDDRLTAVREKLDEYKNWGVPHVWMVDPNGKRLYTCDRTLTEVASLHAPELGIEITPRQVFQN